MKLNISYDIHVIYVAANGNLDTKIFQAFTMGEVLTQLHRYIENGDDIASIIQVPSRPINYPRPKPRGDSGGQPFAA